jgi:hypothetical protein
MILARSRRPKFGLVPNLGDVKIDSELLLRLGAYPEELAVVACTEAEKKEGNL